MGNISKSSCPCTVFLHEDHNAFQLFWRETVTISRKEAVSDESGRKTKVCTGSAQSLFMVKAFLRVVTDTSTPQNVDDVQTVKE